MVTGEASTRPRLNTDSEIVSLFARPKCPKPKRFPIENMLGFYSTLSVDLPLLCGFSEQEKGCFEYQFLEKHWIIKQFGMIENRSHASSVDYGNGIWIITGGQKYSNGVPVILETSEILIDLAFTQGPNLPIPLSGHCTVKISDDQLLVAGGYGESYLTDTYILNINQNTSDAVPSMKYGRFGHACGKVITLFNEVEVILAGGLHQDKIEKYSLVHDKWFTMPNIEDHPIFKSATVQGESTFVITGGVELEPECTTSNCRQDIIKIFDDYNKAFKQHTKTLSNGRGNHLATSIPIDTICSGNE